LELAAGAALPDLTPLGVQRTGDHLTFTLMSSEDILPELPADYEQLLSMRLQEILAEPRNLTAEVNLADLTGISSRQLGSLIALQKVLRPRFGRVPVTGLSANVRHVLTLTHVDRLFELP
jgi:anti-anti-sigma regulatory factor